MYSILGGSVCVCVPDDTKANPPTRNFVHSIIEVPPPLWGQRANPHDLGTVGCWTKASDVQSSSVRYIDTIPTGSELGGSMRVCTCMRALLGANRQRTSLQQWLPWEIFQVSH
jgi:hypothetical protein